jgi:ArsR family transcriptional regulator
VLTTDLYIAIFLFNDLKGREYGSGASNQNRQTSAEKNGRKDIRIMKAFIRVMKALSDPNRVKMIKMLQFRPFCVCEIKEALNIAQSTASKHLKILEDAGLVTGVKDGLWVNYSLDGGNGSPYSAHINEILKHWLDDEPEIRELALTLGGIDRHEIVAKPG